MSNALIKVLAGTGIALAFFALAAAGLYLPGRKVTGNDSAEAFIAFLDSRIPKLMKRYNVPGVSVALVRGGQIVYTGAYGVADRQSGRLMAAELPMRVESISKPVTAWAILKLAQEGKINLDDPLEKHLRLECFPLLAASSGSITVRQLLTHTAGLPLGNVAALYAPQERAPSLEESVSARAVPFQPPGKGFSYSNVGYHLLELLIESVTGQDFAEYMETHILDPLGMKHASFDWTETTLAAAPLGHALSGKMVPLYRYPEKAAGGLIATAEDIARFCIAGMPDFSAQSILSRESIWRLYAPQSEKLGVYGMVFDTYGLGYYTEELSGGGTAVSHGGQGTGWMSHFHAVPQTGDAIVILSNSQRSWPLFSGILHGWARWCGFSPPGMARILMAEAVLWAVIGVVMMAALFLGAGTIRHLLGGQGRLVPLKQFCGAFSRLSQAGISVAILTALGWCAGQKDLFLLPVFPAAAPWFGGLTAIFAAALLAAALIS